MMLHNNIRKSDTDWAVTPNLVDYDETRASFSWKDARRCMDGLPDGAGLNIAHEAVDRHANGARADHVALRWLDRDGRTHDYSYARLQLLTNRFANVLRKLGVGKGECVFVLTPRIPELYIAALGTLKNASVFSPLFSAFGPEPIRARMDIGKARVLVTTASLYHRKIKPIRQLLPQLVQVLIVHEGNWNSVSENTWDFHDLLAAAADDFTIPPTDPEDMALLHFTSGTTGKPKGAVHVQEAVVMHHMTGRLALDLHADDVFWCTADPGWVTGTSYGMIAPLAIGATMIVDEGEFDARRWYGILQEQQVSVWYTAPTAVRLMMRPGSEIVAQYDTSSLRFMASVGEPLNPEAVMWGEKAFGLPFHDNWWQTETGSIMISNFAAMDIRPGSMGKPVPGIEAAIVQRSEGGDVQLIEEPGEQGELALRVGWPSMFRNYLGEEDRFQQCFADGWYLTEDLVKRDADGYYWFVGRTDDVIKSSGHLIGPFEVESVLMEDPAVAEVGVIGVPDAVTMEMVKAFVVLKPGYQASERLRRQLLGHARERLGAAVAPREIEFRNDLPRNRSGKIMRRLLKARELGLSEGDISTLE